MVQVSSGECVSVWPLGIWRKPCDLYQLVCMCLEKVVYMTVHVHCMYMYIYGGTCTCMYIYIYVQCIYIYM